MIDLDTLQELINKAAILLPVVVGVVQVGKIAGIPARWLPLFALILGALSGGFFLTWTPVGILVGATLGLGSVGLFEFGKTTIAGK